MEQPSLGESDLPTLIRDMRPALDSAPYAIISVPSAAVAQYQPTYLGMFYEAEGVTLILAPGEAERLGAAALERWARITLSVHSSLAAVGFIARLATALAEAGISANPVAGFYHDHLFVPWEARHRAVDVLQALGRGASG